uniref:ABC transporter ATP-binding protein n=1 Tax=Heterorhabditis bacteriophora TaxID=37862 RepID=A0A1I7WGG6_HETBA
MYENAWMFCNKVCKGNLCTITNRRSGDAKQTELLRVAIAHPLITKEMHIGRKRIKKVFKSPS